MYYSAQQPAMAGVSVDALAAATRLVAQVGHPCVAAVVMLVISEFATPAFPRFILFVGCLAVCKAGEFFLTQGHW